MRLLSPKSVLLTFALLPLLLAPARAQDLAAPVPAVDTQDRQAVEDIFNAYLRPQLYVPGGFTGNVPAGDAGTLSEACLSATLTVVNYYRALAGVPGDVVLDPGLSDACQQAALMMAAKGALSHYPDPSWPFYTAAGARAAANSNLGLDAAGPRGIDGFMEDTGSTNGPVGHRRWIIYPVTDRMGYGGVDSPGGGAPYSGGDALWVIGGSSRRARPVPRDGFVAWPSPGWFPVLYDGLPGRWSFSLGGADLSAATATVNREDGLVLKVTPETYVRSYGEPTLVWQVLDPTVTPGVLRGVADHVFTVTVSGVRVAGVVNSYTYQVFPFVPSPTSIVISTVRGNYGYTFFYLSRIGGDLNVTLTVNLKVGGSASSGTDYSPLAGGHSVTIPAGQRSASVSFQALVGGDANRKVKLTVLAGEGYVPGAPALAKVKVGSP